MENIKNIKIELPNGDFEEITIITNADGSETSMQKADYERRQAQQVEHLTESVTKAK